MEKKQKQTKILHTFMIVVLALVIFPIFIVVWQLVGINRESLRSNERLSQLKNIDDVSKQVEMYVSGHRNQIVGIARTLEVSNILDNWIKQDQTERDQYLSQFLESDSNIILAGLMPPVTTQSSVSIFARWDGNRITQDEVKNIAKEAVEGLGQIQKKTTYVGKPHYIPSSTEFAVVIAEPMISKGQNVGAALAVISLESVFRFVKQQVGSVNTIENWALIKSGQRVVFLVNEEGKVIVHPDREMVYSARDLSNWPIVDSWKKNKNIAAATEPFELEHDTEKLSMLGSYNTVHLTSGVDLGVIAVTNEKAAYSSVREMFEEAIKISLVIVIIALFVGIALAFWVTSPIKALANGAHSIALGDFSKRITVKTRSEIGELAETFNSMADQVQRYVNDLKFAANENHQLFLGMIRALAEAIDGKDPYTRGHSERVMLYSVLIAQHMGMSNEEVEDIRISGILHDIGKIGIDDRVLKKPAALTEDEYSLMKQHPQKGANIMSQIPQMKKYIPGMYYHHECMDGKGYPLGLKGDQIPMMARIISVADTFDAMTTNRPYQRAMETSIAVSRIYKFSGTRYDPVVVKALDDALRNGELDEVIKGYQDSQMD